MEVDWFVGDVWLGWFGYFELSVVGFEVLFEYLFGFVFFCRDLMNYVFIEVWW